MSKNAGASWHCSVAECRFPHAHITSSHKCGSCGEFGHGQIECGDPAATAALKATKLPSKLHCTLPGCHHPATHVNAGHQCGECQGFGHSGAQCGDDDSDDDNNAATSGTASNKKKKKKAQTDLASAAGGAAKKKAKADSTTTTSGGSSSSSSSSVHWMDKWYFLAMQPDEDSYDDVLIYYDVHLVPLKQGVIAWFQELWQMSPGDVEQHLEDDLGTHPHGLHTLCDDPDDSDEKNSPESAVVDNLTFDALKTHFQHNLAVEKEVIVGDHTLRWGTTMEFDSKYAFFCGRSLANDELGDTLSRLVRRNEKEQRVERAFHRVQCSAYLPSD